MVKNAGEVPMSVAVLVLGGRSGCTSFLLAAPGHGKGGQDGRGPAGLGIVPGSGSDPSVIFEAGIRIPAVFGAVGIKLVVSRRIRAELRSAGPNMQHPGYYT